MTKNRSYSLPTQFKFKLICMGIARDIADQWEYGRLPVHPKRNNNNKNNNNNELFFNVGSDVRICTTIRHFYVHSCAHIVQSNNDRR